MPRDGGPILDIGSGTGAWALAIAEAIPTKRIIATDLTPPKVTSLSNVTFMKANAEEDWHFGETFSFIHGRMLASGIQNWPKLLDQCFRNLEPGGWLELLDLCHPFQAENLVATSESDFLHWGRTAEKSWALNGLDYRATTKHVARLQELGFENVQEAESRWPLGTWPEEENEKRLGELSLRNFTHFLVMAGTSIICQDPAITEKEAQALVDAALGDLTDNQNKQKFYLTM